ncbi:MAG: hypothetical protein EBW58_12490 [Betaproteobacteria bacterium]|nr:hypothetical protein [Betaproteobacteria bacterium]
MVVGDNKPFIAALVTIDPDAIKGWIVANKKDGATIATLAKDPDLIAVIQTAVDEANKAVSRAESIRKFTILPSDFTIADITAFCAIEFSRVMKFKPAEAGYAQIQHWRDRVAARPSASAGDQLPTA